ncbi:hypothetical protein [Stenotrophomonas ginsengisoli]|nr:hypothetical protein [Stenotrophomonas ginsengisoli]
MMLRRTGLVVAVCSMALLAACSSGPEATVKGFYKALDAGKTDTAKGYLSAQITEMLGNGKLDMALAEGAKNMADCGGLDKVEVTLSGEGEVRRGSAAISFKGDCPAKNDDVMLVQENDAWKIGIGK